MQKTISISEANKTDLLAFAKDTLGLQVSSRNTSSELRSQIQACGHSEITVTEVEAPEAVQTSTDKVAAPKPKKNMVKVLISTVDQAGGDEPVPVSVNGKAMLIPRGEPVDIPEAYYEVLKNAVSYRYISLKDGGIDPTPQKIQAYPHQRIM